MKNQPEQTEAPHSQPEDGAARATINGVDIPIHIMSPEETREAEMRELRHHAGIIVRQIVLPIGIAVFSAFLGWVIARRKLIAPPVRRRRQRNLRTYRRRVK